MPHNVDVMGLGQVEFPDEMDEPQILEALRAKFEPVRQFGQDFLGGLSPLDKIALATSPIPIVGDIAGLAADVNQFVTDPESRTILNFALSAAGVLPFVPSSSVLRAGESVTGLLKKNNPSVDFSISERGSNITLDKIVVPKELRSAGIGSKFMEEFLQSADAAGRTIGLTPSTDFGGTKSGLQKFYKKFGFVPNKGKNKNFEISETLIREPIAAPNVSRTTAGIGPQATQGRQFKTSTDANITFIESPDGKLLKVRPGEAPVDLTGTVGEVKIRKKLAEIDAAGGLEAFEAQSASRKAVVKDRIQSIREEAAEQGAGYRVQHQAPTIRDGSGVAGFDVEKALPDVNGPNGLQFYGTGSPHDMQALGVLRSMRGRPDKVITIYRSVPKSVKDINVGDWVATTRGYAKDHAAGETGWHILTKKVRAKDIATDGNSIHEWGYDPL